MKTIILTGGTGLIGKALAINLLKQGNRVVISSRFPDKKKFISENELESVEGFFEVLTLDYLDKSAISRFVNNLIQLKIFPDSIIHQIRSIC